MGELGISTIDHTWWNGPSRHLSKAEPTITASQTSPHPRPTELGLQYRTSTAYHPRGAASQYHHCIPTVPSVGKEACISGAIHGITWRTSAQIEWMPAAVQRKPARPFGTRTEGLCK